MQSRKYLYATISSIKSLKHRYQCDSNEIQRATSKEDYERTIHHFDKMILNLEGEFKNLPIGYRYTGVCVPQQAA
jgi:hypothetical protein